ncbi:MAG TPA: helix-hairpin-helix domain-containing protein [Myxococcales bacterium]
MHVALMAALLCAAAEPSAAAPAGGTPAAAAASPQHKKSGKPPMAGVVNLNRATEAELQLLPGIGKRRAQLIVERRAKKPFASVDEVGHIKGMRALVHRLRSHLAVEGDTTLRPLRP